MSRPSEAGAIMRRLRVHHRLWSVGRVLVLLLLLNRQLPQVVGLSEFRDYFPNGYNLDDQEFGHVADTTLGQSSEGGRKSVDGEITFGHNQFGRDYAAAEDKWNTFLCALDSDGDGQSNGLELGDPCCQWQQSNYQGNGIENFTSTDISSPGRARFTTQRNSNGLCRDIHDAQCAAFEWTLLTADDSSLPHELLTPEVGGSALCVVAISASHFVVVGDSSHSAPDQRQRNASTWTVTVPEAGNTARWELIVPASHGPPMVANCAGVAFHNLSQTVVIVGGHDVQGNTVQDTWALSFSSRRWKQWPSTVGIKPSARHSSSFGIFEDHMYIFGGLHNSTTVLNDIWRLDLDASVQIQAAAWTRLSKYAPVPLDPRRNPVAMSRTTGEVLLYAESARQVWRWTLPSLDGASQGGENDGGGFWKQTFIGWPPQWRTNVTFVSAFEGFLFLLGGNLADTSKPADSTMWMTSNRSIEAVSPPACPETCYGSDCDFWYDSGFTYDYLELYFGCDCNNCRHVDTNNFGEFALSVTQRWEPVPLAVGSSDADTSRRSGSSLVELDEGRVLSVGGCLRDSVGSTCDVDSDGFVDVIELRRSGTAGTTTCKYAPPRQGPDVNSSQALLAFPRYGDAPRYDAYTLLLDEAQNFRCALAWSIVARGTAIRFSLRAELPADGYLSLAFVHPNWPIRDLVADDPEFYSGKMYGADAVFGWIDSSGEGHVEAWGLPTYESADILDAPKADGYFSDPELSMEEGMMTLSFTRTFAAPNVLEDVAIDPSGSWIMWALAPNGLFYPTGTQGSENDRVMVTHTERHESFIVWENPSAYSNLDTTPRPDARCSSPPPETFDVAYSVTTLTTANSSVSCEDGIEGDVCTVACTPAFSFPKGSPDTVSITCEYEQETGTGHWSAVGEECVPLECSFANLLGVLTREGLDDGSVDAPNATDCLEQTADNRFVYGTECPLRCATGFAVNGNVSNVGMNVGFATCSNVTNPNNDISFAVSSASRALATQCVPILGYCDRANPLTSENAQKLELGIGTDSADCTSQSTIGSGCRLQCPQDDGDNMPNTYIVQCLESTATSGMWSDVPSGFSCDGDCQTINVSNHISFSGSENCTTGLAVGSGESCQLHIELGYECHALNGSILLPSIVTQQQELSHVDKLSVLCGSNGNWPVACNMVDDYCRHRGEIFFDMEHGSVQCEGQRLGDRCFGSCDVGYAFEFQNTGFTSDDDAVAIIGRCVDDHLNQGAWTSFNVTCEKIDDFCAPSLVGVASFGNGTNIVPHVSEPSASMQFCEEASLGDSCFTYCRPGFSQTGASANSRTPGIPSLEIANRYVCSESGVWEYLPDGSSSGPNLGDLNAEGNCSAIEQYCEDFPSQQLSNPNAVIYCRTGSRAGDECVVECSPGFEVLAGGGDANLVTSTVCDATSAQWTVFDDISCAPINQFCPSTLEATLEVDGETITSNYSCTHQMLGAKCPVECPDGTTGTSRNGTCLYSQSNEGGVRTWQGVWTNPPLVRCRSSVESNALRDSQLPGFVHIDGDGDRELGLSWGFVDGGQGAPFDHPYGYVTFVLKTQLSYGYLGIGFGELPILMIPGDGVWGWMNNDGEGEVVAYRMVSYVTQEIADEGRIADNSGYLADGSMSFEDGILTFNCTLPLNLTSEASGNDVVVPILADGTITHFQWALSDNSIGVTMHTEWGSLDIDLSQFNATAESTTETSIAASSEALFVSLGVWAGALMLVVIILKCLHSKSHELDEVRRRHCLVGWCHRPFGQLCACCRIAHYESSHWARPLRYITLDFASTLSGWSVASGFFYASVAALFAAVCITAPMTLARSSGWLCIGVFSLLLFPVARKTVVLSLFYGLPFEAAIGHHRILGRAFVLIQLIHILFVYLKWGDNGSDPTSVVLSEHHFGVGMVIPVWGWVSFAATLALAFFSIEFFRRRVFEVFYYSHIFLFVFIVVVTAKHVGVLPSITVDYFGDISSSPGSESASQNVTTGQTRVDPFAAFDGQLAPLRSFAAFWGCILLPLVFYAVDVGERMVLALNCCGGADVVVTRAKVCYSGQQHGSVVMIEVTHRRMAMQYESGQYCYLTFPQLSVAASHPFTISSAPGLIRGFNDDDDKEEGSDAQLQHQIPRSRMTFHIKGLGDFTNRVCELVARFENDPAGLRVQVKGPYGGGGAGSNRNSELDTVDAGASGGALSPTEFPVWVLVGGGIGVTPLASILEAILLHHLTQRLRQQEEGSDEKSPNEVAGRHWVLLLWTARHEAEFAIFEKLIAEAQRCAALAGSKLQFTAKLFLTSGKSTNARVQRDNKRTRRVHAGRNDHTGRRQKKVKVKASKFTRRRKKVAPHMPPEDSADSHAAGTHNEPAHKELIHQSSPVPYMPSTSLMPYMPVVSAHEPGMTPQPSSGSSAMHFNGTDYHQWLQTNAYPFETSHGSHLQPNPLTYDQSFMHQPGNHVTTHCESQASRQQQLLQLQQLHRLQQQYLFPELLSQFSSTTGYDARSPPPEDLSIERSMLRSDASRPASFSTEQNMRQTEPKRIGSRRSRSSSFSRSQRAEKPRKLRSRGSSRRSSNAQSTKKRSSRSVGKKRRVGDKISVTSVRSCIVHGRPNFRQIFRDALNDGTLIPSDLLDKFYPRMNDRGDAVCVFACGPWGMLVEAQSAAHEQGFQFHKEIFDL